MQKRKLGVLLCTLLVFTTIFSVFAFSAMAEETEPVAQYEDEGYYIENMQVDVIVDEARVFYVTETITVFYNEERRGIYRTLYTEGDAESYTIENINVEGAPFEVEEYGITVDIRIGDPSTYVTGAHTYVITYELHHYQDYLEDGDYIYFNLIGNDWDTYIHNMRATITYPKEAEAENIVITSGYYGGAYNSYDIEWAQKDNVITIEDCGPFEPYDSATINIRLNEGAFADAPAYPFPYTVNSMTSDITLTKEKEYLVKQQFVVTIPEENDGYKYNPVLPLYRDNTDSLLADFTVEINGTPADGEKYYDAPSEYSGTYTLNTTKPGKYTVNISYKLTLKIDSDIAYNFVSGFDVDGPIEKVNINFVTEVPFVDHPEVTFGRNKDDPAAYTLQYKNDTLTLETEKVMYPYEKLAITFFVDESAFVRGWTTPVYVLLGITAVCVVIAVLLHTLFGRDEKIIPVVEVYPPNNVNAPEAGYIINNQTSSKDMTTILYNWANAGYIKLIEEENGQIRFEKLKDIDVTLPSYEQKLFYAMFARGDGLEVKDWQLRNKFFRDLLIAESGMKLKYENPQFALYKENSLLQFITMVIGYIPVAVITYLSCKLNQEPGYFIGAVIALVPHIANFFIWSRMQNAALQKNKNSTFIGGGIATIAVSVLYFMATIVWRGAYGFVPTLACVAVVAASALSVLLAVLIKKRSQYGTEITGALLGFRQFIEVAEKDRLEMLIEQDPTYFYNTLPYAQVFGLTKVWTEKFREISLPVPAWYESRKPFTDMQTYVFLSRLQGAMGRASNVATQRPAPPPPSSSGGGFSSGGSSNSFGGGSFGGSSGGGFSGGGFSGGGSGGGGGRSW